jgi:hypothetical protein
MDAMLERRHLRIIRAVQRVVAAAKDLADAEKALKRGEGKRQRRVKRSQRTKAEQHPRETVFPITRDGGPGILNEHS